MGYLSKIKKSWALETMQWKISLVKWLVISILRFNLTKVVWNWNIITIHGILGFFLSSLMMKETLLIRKLLNMSCKRSIKLSVWDALSNRFKRKLNLMKLIMFLKYVEKKLVLCTTEADIKLNTIQLNKIGTPE